MVNIPEFSIDPTKERGDMENQARLAIQDLNDFILGGASAHITHLALDMFLQSLARYERDFETVPGHAESKISWGYDKAPDRMPVCKKCEQEAVPNDFYGFWCPTCNTYPTI